MLERILGVRPPRARRKANPQWESVEERILLEKRKKGQSSCDLGAGLRGEVRPARTGVYLQEDPKFL